MRATMVDLDPIAHRIIVGKSNAAKVAVLQHREMVMNQIAKTVIEELEAIRENFAAHPFATVERAHCKSLFADFLAMSQAFPYLQAGSQKRLIMRCMEKNIDLPRDVAITGAIGSLLSWDEIGGLFITRHLGFENLPALLSGQYSHTALLRANIVELFGEDMTPNYSPTTVAYLRALLVELEATDPVRRCAAMVSFEMHARPDAQTLAKIGCRSRKTMFSIILTIESRRNLVKSRTMDKPAKANYCACDLSALLARTYFPSCHESARRVPA